MTISRSAVNCYATSVLLASVCCLASRQQSRVADPTSIRTHMPLLRSSRAAATLQQEMDSDSRIGVCSKGSSLWQGLPNNYCSWQYCLWSKTAHGNVDLWLNVFSSLRGLAIRCQKPQGGQKALAPGKLPEVAFIITMHNHGYMAAQCLLELFRTAREASSAEFILVDDGSTEDVSVAADTGRQLQHLFGVRFRHICLKHATGYGPANNAGVQLATAKYVALMNSDAHVINGWLRPLLETMKSRSDIGMVGPLLVGNNNLIQEASSLITAEAGAANLYKNTAAGELPSFVNRRFKADYLSTAATVMVRDVYLKLGGFDDVFKEGYWEDVDLAMRVRQAGLNVILQPLSIVYHQGGGTFGSNSFPATARFHQDRLMKDNGAVFRERWKEVIAAVKHCPEEAPLHQKLRRLNSPCVLYVDEVRPQPSRDAGSLRAEGIMKILLGEGFSVTFAATFAGFAYTEPLYATHMRFLGIEVWPETNPALWPLTVGEGIDIQCRFDVIFVARKDVLGSVLALLRKACPKAPIIFDTVDVHFVRESRAKMVAGTEASFAANTSLPAVLEWLEEKGPANAEMRVNRDAELRLVTESNLTVVVSEQERTVLHQYLPDAPVHVVSIIMPEILQPLFPCARRQGLLFVGSLGHPPNVQAVEHLLKEVMPALQSRLPQSGRNEFHLHIVGSGNPARVTVLLDQHKELATLHVNLSPALLELLLARAKVFVAPLLVGGGVKGKVNQAMAHGLPVVAYEVAVEGIDAQHGRNVMVAHGAEQFADHILELHADCKLWSRLSHAGLELISGQYTETTAHAGLMGVMQAVHVAKPDNAQKYCRAG